MEEQGEQQGRSTSKSADDKVRQVEVKHRAVKKPALLSPTTSCLMTNTVHPMVLECVRPWPWLHGSPRLRQLRESPRRLKRQVGTASELWQYATQTSMRTNRQTEGS